MIVKFTLVYKHITRGYEMVIKKDKHRFVVIIEKETFENFKTIAEKEKRSASNLAAKMIEEYVKENMK